MNLLDHIVTEIVTPPYRRSDDEYHCWEAVVRISCYGPVPEPVTFRAVSREEIEQRAEVGYSYLG